MGNISLREAVKVFDVSRPTLLKSLKTGKVSGIKDGKGRWEIDPSELSRVYQKRSGSDAEIYIEKSGKIDRDFNVIEGDLNERIQQLEADLNVEKAHRQAAENLAQERARHLDDLRRLLPSPTQPSNTPSQKIRSWWPW